ncbi:hypothetical protein P152DRAFT_297026 [Eremomyces bilateralis CBS 781.70]|uniref:Thioesterase domain-containing protein n=1 Tax=Eremomyces bilateralis CBS 781.70 TaxID=1392243 RepID=A0A6G1G7I1_9PEZI|nr:uncharacterized protein P152DRAFT_297026 [Eremomyces bilateralis CBS 781.70]KAF1813896.1 hypothetical protein P152DRAFT_297026 [Eremomyces bilateralis CBS 781.70]
MRVVFHIPIKGIHFNLAGSAFGGALASVMDIATGHAIATVSRPGFWPAPHGISRVINISFLKPVTRTGEVRIEAKVMQFGKSAAMVRGELTSLDGKEIYCTVEHHKLSFPPPGEVRLPWDDELDQIIADKSRMLVKL